MRAKDSSKLRTTPNRTHTVSTPKLRILNAILNGNTSQKQIIQTTNSSKSTISAHIRELKQLNLIQRTIRSSIQILELTEQGKKLAKSFCDAPKSELFVNHHNFRVELAIQGTKSIEDWGFINRATHKNHFHKFGSQGFNVEITNNKVFLYLYNIYSNTAEEARAEALDKIADAIEYLYTHHRIKVIPKFKTLTQHIAYCETPLASYAKLAGLHYKGKTMHCDYSDGVAHQEFVDPKKAYDNALFWARTTEERIANRISPLTEYNKLNTVIDSMNHFAKHLYSHVAAVQELGAAAQASAEATRCLQEQVASLTTTLNRRGVAYRLWKWITNKIKGKLALK